MSYITVSTEIDLDYYESEIMEWLAHRKGKEAELEHISNDALIDEIKSRYTYLEAEKIDYFFRQVDLFNVDFNKIKQL